MEDAFALGRAGGAWMMEVTANPQAEGFYARLGFTRSGLVTTVLRNRQQNAPFPEPNLTGTGVRPYIPASRGLGRPPGLAP